MIELLDYKSTRRLAIDHSLSRSTPGSFTGITEAAARANMQQVQQSTKQVPRSTPHGEYAIATASPLDGSTNLWDQVWAKVNTLVGGGKMQLIYPFMDWTWATPKPGYIDATAYNVVGQIPKWSAIGKYSPSATDLYSSYKNMINTCPKLTLTPSQALRVKEVQDQINAAQTTLTEDENARKYAWAQAIKDLPHGFPHPVYEKWYQTSGQKAIIDADSAAVQKAATTKADIVAQQNPNYKEAIEKAAMPTDQYARKAGFLKCDVSGYPEWRAGFLVSQGRDWVAQLSDGGGNPLIIEMDASKASSAMKESWAGGAADYGSSFFGIYANGSWHDMKLTESDSNVKVQINIKAVTQVPVKPGEWYNPGYLGVLAREHQWNDPFTTEGGDSPVFGKGGLLPLMITGMIAGYQTSFTITMSSATFQNHESEFKAAGGIRIGPFHIGGGYHTHSDSWTKSTSGTSFTGESKAKYPFIIGFIVAEPGIGE